ncbi:MAG: hypothetical protein CSA62_11230 [Planctomycetota bacterium]|nr:MAG: hypothetical protein CSA62_11230 [Planctomycetota bacterium]
MGLGAFGSAPACHCQHEHQHENQHEGPQERGGAAIAVQRLCQSDEHDSGDCQDISIDLPQLWVSAERSHELSSEQLSPQPMPAFASCLAAALVLAPFEEQEKAWPPPTQSRATRQELDQLRSVVLLI